MTKTLLKNSEAFINYVADWKTGLALLTMADVVKQEPGKVVVISVDVINGFCYDGPLASPRVAAIVDPIATLFTKSYQAGIQHFILTQDTHLENAIEFEQFPPHCISGTGESQTVDKFQTLPFFNKFKLIPKNSLNSLIGTTLEAWLDDHPQVNTFITVGDCTDLCTYQLAMHLKLRANARNESVRVILPADCVDTYDLPVHIAKEIGAMPHNGDLLHHLFLYHMQLNGIEVVAKLI